jgi:integrase
VTSTLPRLGGMIRRMNDIDHAVDAYVGELARLGRSPNTRRKYREILWKFCDHVGDRRCDEIERADCTTFLDRWADSSPSTLALNTSILAGFFSFLVDLTVLDRSPMEKVRRPPRKRPEDLDVVTISGEDVERMFDAAAEWDEVLCLYLIGYLGPRRNAVSTLRRRDVDLERGLARFKEKGGKVITKPIPDELVAIMRVAQEAGVWISPDDYLVPNRRRQYRSGERSDKVIYRIVKDVAARARVHAHPHAIRAAFAVRFAEQKPDRLVALKELMGHSRIETTMVYLRRQDKAREMESVRDLTWSRSAFPSSAGMPPTGFEPVLGESSLPEPLRRKLEELRARSRGRVDQRR